MDPLARIVVSSASPTVLIHILLSTAAGRPLAHNIEVDIEFRLATTLASPAVD